MKVVIDDQLLNDIDDLLAHLEDYIHGKDGKAITTARGWLSKDLTVFQNQIHEDKEANIEANAYCTRVLKNDLIIDGVKQEYTLPQRAQIYSLMYFAYVIALRSSKDKTVNAIRFAVEKLSNLHEAASKQEAAQIFKDWEEFGEYYESNRKK